MSVTARIEASQFPFILECGYSRQTHGALRGEPRWRCIDEGSSVSTVSASYALSTAGVSLPTYPDQAGESVH